MVEVSKRLLLQVIFTSICAVLYLRTLYHYPSENSDDIYSSLKQCSNQFLTQKWFRKVQSQTRPDSNSHEQLDNTSSFHTDEEHHVNTWIFTAEDWISWLNEITTPVNETEIELFEAEKLPELQGMPCARWGLYNRTLHPTFAILIMNEQSNLNSTLYSLLCEAGADPSSVLIFSYADTNRDSGPTREIIDQYQASLIVLNSSSPLIAQRRLERLYRYVFDYVFSVLNQTYLVILEDDLQSAPDMVSYFDGISKIMDYDPSISCASAWNDLGYPAMSMNEHILRRTSSFLNLGWMLSRWYYEKTVYPILRDNPDMDWISVQHKAMRENRLDCVFPEVPRVHHASKQNPKSSPTTSWMQRDFFDNMLLADTFNQTLEFGRVSQESYQAYLEELVSNSLQLEDLSDTLYFRNTVFTYYCSKCRQTNFLAWNDLITNIFGFHKSNLGERSPQGIYQNTMFIGLYTNQVLLVASDSPHRKNLSNHYAVVTPTQKRTVEYDLFKKVFIGLEGQSCDETCKRLNRSDLSCREPLLHTFNNCSVLQRFMRLSREGSCSGECIVNRDFHFPAVRLLPGTDRMYSCTTTYARYVNCQAKPPPGYRRLCYCE